MSRPQSQTLAMQHELWRTTNNSGGTTRRYCHESNKGGGIATQTAASDAQTHSHTVTGAALARLGGRNLVVADKLHVREREDSSTPADLPLPLPVDVGGHHFDNLSFLQQPKAT